jgi:RNA recognition motif-containing protein
MPSGWNEAKLKQLFGKYGEIDRIMMAKNNPKSKRKDFAFVNFSTRDAALASINALNDVEFTEGDEKVGL